MSYGVRVRVSLDVPFFEVLVKCPLVVYNIFCNIGVIKMAQSHEFLATLCSTNNDYTQGVFLVCDDMKEAISVARQVFDFKGGRTNSEAGIVTFLDKSENAFVLSVLETANLSPSIVAEWRQIDGDDNGVRLKENVDAPDVSFAP